MPKGKRTFNKSAFVRNLPAGMPASEVVAKAKAQGITLSDKYVYNVRAKAKAQGGGSPGRRGRPKGTRSAKASGSAQEQLVELALEVGLAKAEALLARLRSAIRHAVVG